MRAQAAAGDDVPQALYRFFDRSGCLLYVGITMNPASRWKAHRKEKPWWLEVANITVEHHLDRASVAEAERQAIQSERPRYNIIHNHADGGERLAGLLSRVPDVQARLMGTCPGCGGRKTPGVLYPTDRGSWLCGYECCDDNWTQEFDR